MCATLQSFIETEGKAMQEQQDAAAATQDAAPTVDTAPSSEKAAKEKKHKSKKGAKENEVPAAAAVAPATRPPGGRHHAVTDLPPGDALAEGGDGAGPLGSLGCLVTELGPQLLERLHRLQPTRWRSRRPPRSDLTSPPGWRAAARAGRAG